MQSKSFSAEDVPLELVNAYLPLSYEVSLKMDHVKPNFQGSVKIPLVKNELFQGNADECFSFTLHAHKLIVTSAELRSCDGGIRKAKVTYDREHQTVTFSTEEAVVALQILVSFFGLVNPIKTFRDETYGVFKTNYSDSVHGKSDNYVIATHTQPFGCRMVFPVVDQLTYKVPVKLSITTRSLFKVVSNSILESTEIIDLSENSVFTFKPTPPIAPSLFGFVLGDLQKVDICAGNTPIRAYVTKGDSAYAQYALKSAAVLLPRFEATLGTKYPLEKLDIVTLPFLSDAVMENWGMVTVIKNAIFLKEETASKEALFQVRQLVAHQLTHQWIGNLVSVDDWKYTWLVEAFATFVGNYVLSVADLDASDSANYDLLKLLAMQDFMDTDCFLNEPIPSFHEHMNLLKVDRGSKTTTIFEQNYYEKGMVLINMIANLFKLEHSASDLADFFHAFQFVFEKFKYKSVKPFEIWGVLNEHTSHEILAFVHSWTRYVGYPLVKVKIAGGKIVVEQNRFLFGHDVTDLQLENNPYHVPLAMKILDNQANVKVANLMLTDRSMELEIPPAQFLCLNADNQFYYKTVYDPDLQLKILQNIASNRYTGLDLMGMIKDYGKILGQPVPKLDAGLFGANQLTFLIKICDELASKLAKVDYEVLKCALGYIEIVNSIFVHFTEYTEFHNWLDRFSSLLFEKLQPWDKVVSLQANDYDKVEFEVRNIVLQLASLNKEAQGICRRVYKNLVNSGVTQKFVAKELYSLVFNVTMATASMTEYKQILSLVKNGDVSFLKHTNGTANEVQMAAVSSLGFCQKKELLAKTLNFVNNNIDSKMIELALIGFKYKHDAESKQMIWAWYKTNYDGWVRRSLRKGSDWAKQIAVAVENITRLILGEVMQGKKEETARFIKEKVKSLPPHKLEETYGEVEGENEEKRRIAAYYEKLWG